ncbi:MAG TPA: maleylpyruvate isomerase family mycothiol-dependent enzyme, partial [Acidimicrobiales bacterium]|nr:maleylpyruvate isomerase family mycothiol-dependent enzyme [Acidimicrobiales bacterium]
DWDVRGLCDHLARVYQGRGYVIEHAAFKDQDAFELRGDDEDPIEFVQRWSAALVAALADRADDAPTVTFIPEAKTVHFWRRRMALETLVHRTDAELAVGTVSAMDDVLSADGVDELLWFCAEDDEPEQGSEHDEGISSTSTVLLTDGTREWLVTLSVEGASWVRGDGPADATVRGAAPALLLALSGRDLEGIGPSRFGVAAPVVEGDPAAYDRLRRRLGAF